MDTPTLASNLHGFYAVLDRADADLANQLVAPIARGGAGARVLQLRIKGAIPGSAPGAPSTHDLYEAAQLARQITREHGAAFIVNDRLDLALACDADGVHLGQDDLPLATARALVQHLGRPFWIGVSTHDLDQVAAACAGGADYLGYGPVYATSTKANPDPVQGVVGLAAAVRRAGEVPVVAIGGIGVDQVCEVYATGAAAICAISAVNAAADPAAAGRRFAPTVG